MKSFLPVLFLIFLTATPVFAQKSKKGFEYSGTQIRNSFIGKSKMFSEGIKPVNYSIFWNKKKNIIQVNAGPDDKWYTITIEKVDTAQGTQVQIGRITTLPETAENVKKADAVCEIKFQIDRIYIKIGDAKIEEFLLDGATIWDDQKITKSK
jgi:hypothetical protein